MATIQERKNKNIVGVAIFGITESPVDAYIMETPTAGELDLGIEEQIYEDVSDLGEIVIASTDVIAQRPVVSMTVPSGSPQAIALRTGRKLKSSTGQAWAVEKKLRVTAGNNIKAAATTGQEGFGMVADQAASAMWVYSGLGLTIPLTRQTHASFDPAVTPDSFSQGADYSYKISNNVVGSDVFFSFPLTNQNILEIGEEPIGQLAINFTSIMRDLKLARIEIPSASINLADSGPIPLGPGELSLQARVQYDGSTCTPIKYKWIGQARAC